jgi:uncharacterized protein (TIGR03000 family)
MYSVVLMMAMTAGGEAPAGLFHKDCCCGCSCSCYSDCHGCCGCYSSCHGCCGYSSCHGCCGCYSSCHGCCHKSHCHGCCCSYDCHGCCGYYGCHGCCGYGCCGYGCCGWNGCYGGVIAAPAAAPVGPTITPEKIEKSPKSGSVAAPATIIVSLPVDAKLTVDDAATTSTSARRVFVSPTLEAGKNYNYTMKVVFVQDGQTVEQVKKVAITAGAETTVSFEAPAVASVAGR